MKIATWNVNGIRARQEQVAAWLAQEAPEVVCLQEIKASPEQVPESLREYPGYWCYWHGHKGYSGVALLVRQSLSPERPQFAHPHFDHETRIVTATLESGVTVASIYVPNGGKDYPAKLRFFRALRDYAAGFEGSTEGLVLCGDLNIAHREIDVHPKERGTVTGQLPEERALFDELLGTGLVDLGRAMAPEDEGLFTWWAPWRQMRQRNIGWRLDYILPSAALAKSARSCIVARETGTSDHGPVVAEFAG